jgi:hypothetical protein
MRDVTNPTLDPTVHELVSRIPRAYAARGAVPGRKAALTRDPLEAMLATCTDGLVGVRDRAALLFAFASGGRRRSEVAAAVIAVWHPDCAHISRCLSSPHGAVSPERPRVRCLLKSFRRRGLGSARDSRIQTRDYGELMKARHGQ